MQTISGNSNSYIFIATRIGPTTESVALIWILKDLLVLHKYTIFLFLVNKFACCKKLGTRSMSHQCSKYTPIQGLTGLDISNYSNHSFINSGYFYSTSSSPLLLRGAPDYSIDTVLELTRSGATGNYDCRTCPRSQCRAVRRPRCAADNLREPLLPTFVDRRAAAATDNLSARRRYHC